MFTKDRTIEIRARCDEFLKKHNLRMELGRTWVGGYRVSFAGDDYRSPVAVLFDPPADGATSATWDRSAIEVGTYFVEDLEDTGWKIFSGGHVGLESFEDVMEDHPEGMLERLVDWMERSPLVPNRKNLPGIINSKELGFFYYDMMDRLPEAGDLCVVRDAHGERIEFDFHGSRCKVTFVPEDPKEDTPERTLVQVEDGKVRAAGAETADILNALVHCVHEHGLNKSAGRVR